MKWSRQVDKQTNSQRLDRVKFPTVVIGIDRDSVG